MFNLAALGAGLGEFAQQYRQQQEQALRQQQMQMQMQQFAQRQQEQQRQTAAQAGLAALARSGGLDQQFRSLGQMPQAGGGGSPDMGGGMRAGGALTGDPLDLIAKHESGGRNIHQQVVGPQGGYNPSVGRVTGPSSASGPWQMIDPTWRAYAPKAGVDVAQYPTAMSAPVELQRKVAQVLYDEQGFKPWAPYNANLRKAIGGGLGGGSADLAAGTGDFAIPSYGEAPAAPTDTVVTQRRRGPSAVPASMRGYAPPTDADLFAGNPHGRTPGAVGEPGFDSDLYVGWGGSVSPAATPRRQGPATSASFQQPMPEAQYRQQQPGGFGAQGAFGDSGAGAPQQAQQQADPMAAVQQQVQQGIQKTAQTIPPPLFGRVGLQALMKQIDQANPGADEATKFMMLEGAQQLLAPDAKMQYEYWKQQNDQTLKKELYKYEHDLRVQEPTAGSKFLHDPEGNLHEWRPGQPIPKGWQETSQGKAQGQPFQDAETKKWYQVTTSGDVREVDLPAGAVKPGGAAQQIPEELKYPAKWDGMPNTAPPGVRQDVWMASMEYIRTGKMPSLGFQPGMRNLIMQASPAAAHALGVEPARVADLQAQYAGMRHAQIVGGGRAATIELGVQEALKAAPQVLETSKAVPRTQFPTANRFSNWLQEQGGSKETVAFREALNTYLNVYASVVSRTGRLTDAQQKHAYELLSTSMNQGQIERGIQQLDYEMQLMKEAVPEAMGALGGLGAPPALRQQTTPAQTPQQQNQQRGTSGQRPSWAADEADANDGSGNKVYYDRDAGRWVDVNRKPIQ